MNNGTGTIMVYYNKGILKFEGEYLDGKRNGKGKEYFNNGILNYEGEYLDGKWNGYEKEYFDNGKFYMKVNG